MTGLLFIALIALAIFFLILFPIFLILGIVKKSRPLKFVSFICGGLGLVSIAVLFIWQLWAIPSYNENQMEELTGDYVLDEQSIDFLSKVKKEESLVYLSLNSNGTYSFSGNLDLRLRENGTWKTGGIDGSIILTGEDGVTERFVQPNAGNHELIFFESFPDVDSIDFKRIILKKQ